MNIVYTLIALVVLTLSASAQNIRYFIPQGGGARVYEITPTKTAGTFLQTGVRGYLPNGVPIVGITDRAARGEEVLTLIEGTGTANLVLVIADGTIRAAIPNVPLPFFGERRASPDPNDDEVVIQVQTTTNVVSRRVPIGSRPK